MTFSSSERETFSPALSFPTIGQWVEYHGQNVTDKRDAPPQVIFWAADTRYEFLSKRGLWLQYHYMVNLGGNDFIFGYRGLDGPIQINERSSHFLGDTLRYDDFKMWNGRVIVYEINQLSRVSNDWILNHVIPNMVSHGLLQQVCIVFGGAVLFKLFDRTGKDAALTHMRESIMSTYHAL